MTSETNHQFHYYVGVSDQFKMSSAPSGGSRLMVNTDKTNFTEQTPSQVSARQNRRIDKDENK